MKIKLTGTLTLYLAFRIFDSIGHLSLFLVDSKICVSVKPSRDFKCYLVHVLSPSPKSKKIYPEKNSLHFGRWNFLTVRLKNFFTEIEPCTYQPKLEK